MKWLVRFYLITPSPWIEFVSNHDALGSFCLLLSLSLLEAVNRVEMGNEKAGKHTDQTTNGEGNLHEFEEACVVLVVSSHVIWMVKLRKLSDYLLILFKFEGSLIILLIFEGEQVINYLGSFGLKVATFDNIGWELLSIFLGTAPLILWFIFNIAPRAILILLAFRLLTIVWCTFFSFALLIGLLVQFNWVLLLRHRNFNFLLSCGLWNLWVRLLCLGGWICIKRWLWFTLET